MPRSAAPGPAADSLVYAQDILSKRFELYMWCEEKVAALATVNSILLTAFFVVASGKSFETAGHSEKIAAAASGLALGASIIIVIYHIRPSMSSGRTPRRNIRSVRGVESYDSNDEYYAAMVSLTRDEQLRHVTDQIRGMNRNIVKNERAIKWAGRLMIFGLVAFAYVVAKTVL